MSLFHTKKLFPSWEMLVPVSCLYASLVWIEAAASAARCEVPNPVTDMEVSLDDYNSFTLTWSPPGNTPGSCIEAFKICFGPAGKAEHCSTSKTYSYTNNAASQTDVCTDYTASVVVVGESGYSNATYIDFRTGAAQVMMLKASNTTRTETSLTWDSPDTLACAKHYKLYHCAYDGAAKEDCVYQTKIFSLNRTSFKLGGLQSCKNNHIWLATVDKYGGESNVSIVVHTGDGRPPKVCSVTTTSNRGSTFDVSWLVPADFNPKCHAGYRVCFASQNDGSGLCSFTTTNTYIARRTTACTNYTVNVQTVDGELRHDSHLSAEALHHVFTQPAVPQVRVDFDSQVASLSWPTPDNFSASCLLDYEVVECVQMPYMGGCKELHRETLPANTTVYNSSQLPSCATTLLKFSLVAKNKDIVSIRLKIISTHGNLQPLTNLTVVSANTKQMTLAWTPSDFNACTDHYRVCWQLYHTKACKDTTRELGDTFTNILLVSCHTYSVRIFAVNKKNYSESITADMEIGPENVSNQKVQLSPTSALVTWSLDTSAHRCSTGYSITWCPATKFSNACDGPPTGSVTMFATTTRYDITGLETCAEYFIIFQTLGRNDSLGSIKNVTKIKTPIGKLETITDLTIHQWANKTVSLDIAFPNNTTKCITRFTTCFYETDYEDTEKYCRLMRTEWVNRTQSCTNYTVDITAVAYDKQTSNGSVTFVTGAAQVSDVIPNVSPSGKAVTVTWTFPESNVRCVSYHVVSFIRAEDNLVLIRRNVSKEGTRSSYGGLFFCNSYKVEVQPITLDDESPPAVTALFHTPSNVRSLTGLSVTGIKSDALHVSYTIAETSSNCVHHFQICWEARGVNKSCTNEQGYSSSSVNITGLTPATNYTVEVTPVAPDGQKYVTSTVSGCTLPSNVTMVTDVTVAVHEGGRSVRVSWTIPQKDVESAGEWLITCSRLKDDVAVLEKAVSWTTTSLAIGNLETCVSYSANVQLVNSDLSSTDEASVPFITSGKDGHC